MPPGVSPDLSFLEPSPGAPDRIGPYRVIAEIGRGGMGVVFQAEEAAVATGRFVALKVALPKAVPNPNDRTRFLREARSQAAVDHEHVVPIYFVGEDRGVPYLVMPFLVGETLADALAKNPLPPLPEVLRIGREMAEGLAAAHEVGLVHRDVKPANVWLHGARRRVKLLDFGLARAARGGSGHTVTRTGDWVGTPAFMSPEQVRAETVDARSDLFSLGVVLYRMMTGQPPFRGSDGMAIIASLLIDHPRPPVQLDPTLPAAANDLILKLIAKHPADRPASARDVADELLRIESNLSRTIDILPDRTPAKDPWAEPPTTDPNTPDSERTASWAGPPSEPRSTAEPRSEEPKPAAANEPVHSEEANQPIPEPPAVAYEPDLADVNRPRPEAEIASPRAEPAPVGPPPVSPGAELRPAGSDDLRPSREPGPTHATASEDAGSRALRSLRYIGRFATRAGTIWRPRTQPRTRGHLKWTLWLLSINAVLCGLVAVVVVALLNARSFEPRAVTTAPSAAPPRPFAPNASGPARVATNPDPSAAVNPPAANAPPPQPADVKPVVSPAVPPTRADVGRREPEAAPVPARPLPSLEVAALPRSLAAKLLDCTGEGGVDAMTVRAAQQAWATHLGEASHERKFDLGNKTTIDMVLVPPGKYYRGEGAEASAITLTEPLWVSKYEVTQAQYAAVTGATPSLFKKSGFAATVYPVELISHDHAVAFCKALSKSTNAEYRLLTEAEWEYAYRAGTRTKFYNGDAAHQTGEIAQCEWNNNKNPEKVGSKQPNAFGLYDMAGNVSEWCADRYGEKYDLTTINPLGPATGSNRVIRGGSWCSDAEICRAASRGAQPPTDEISHLGFRLARVVGR